jgi:hypothetical protein
MIRRKHAISLFQATQDSEVLNQLCELASESTQRLKSIAPLLPPSLRAGVHPGPIEGPVWCLLLDNNAVAAKIKQLVPALQAHLRSKGWEVNAIRLKVQMPASAPR